MWWEYKKNKPAKEDRKGNIQGPAYPGTDDKMELKHYVVEGVQRARHRYCIDEQSFARITGQALPAPTIMILQYAMFPRKNKAARNILLEAEEDPPVPRGMTMAQPILRMGPRLPVEPFHGPQHGVPLQDEGSQHQSFNLEAALVTLVGKCDATNERILKLEDQMCLFSNNASILKESYEKAMRTNDLIKNAICSFKGGEDHMREEQVLSIKGNSVSLINVMNMLEEHVTGLSKLFLSLKMANANDDEPIGAYAPYTDDYESVPSNKSRMKKKGLSSKVMMDKDSAAVEENLKFINKSVKFLKEHLSVVKTGEKHDVTVVDEQMAPFCSNVLFLKSMILRFTENGEDMLDEVLHLKKREEKTMRTDDVGEEDVLSLEGNSESVVDVRSKIEECAADLSKWFLSLKIANVTDEEPRGAYATSSGYESGSSGDPPLISVKERVAMLDKRKASKSRLKIKGVSSKVVMAKDSTMLHKELQIINQGVNLLKELVQVGKTRDKEREAAVEGGEGSEGQGLISFLCRELSMMDGEEPSTSQMEGQPPCSSQMEGQALCSSQMEDQPPCSSQMEDQPPCSSLRDGLVRSSSWTDGLIIL